MDAADLAVIRERIEAWADANGSRRRTGSGLIAGLIPERSASPTPTWPGLSRASRGVATPGCELAERAIDRTRLAPTLGSPSVDPLAAERWLEAV